jgi:hypothetical protein
VVADEFGNLFPGGRLQPWWGFALMTAAAFALLALVVELLRRASRR